MLFRQRYKLSIPEPCHEDWQKMHPVDKGRFCDSCCKVVTDFSKMSELEILTFFKKKPENVCGRFTKTQLDQKYVASTTISIPAHKRLIRYMMSLFLIGGVAKQVRSQSQDSVVVQSDTLLQDSSLVLEDILKDTLIVENDSLKSDTLKPSLKITEFKWVFDPSIIYTTTGNVALTGFTIWQPEKPTVFSELRKGFGRIICKTAGVRVNEIDTLATISKTKSAAETLGNGKVPIPQPKPLPEKKSEAILPSFFSLRGRNSGGEQKKS